MITASPCRTDLFRSSGRRQTIENREGPCGSGNASAAPGLRRRLSVIGWSDCRKRLGTHQKARFTGWFYWLAILSGEMQPTHRGSAPPVPDELDTFQAQWWHWALIAALAEPECRESRLTRPAAGCHGECSSVRPELCSVIM